MSKFLMVVVSAILFISVSGCGTITVSLPKVPSIPEMEVPGVKNLSTSMFQPPLRCQPERIIWMSMEMTLAQTGRPIGPL